MPIGRPKAQEPTPPPPAGLLSCHHISHSENEERLWASPEFEAETQRRLTLIDDLEQRLRRRRFDQPSWAQRTWETDRVDTALRYFRRLWTLHRSEYSRLVTRYVEHHREQLGGPACQRLRGVPLPPRQVDGLPSLDTAHAGGRQPCQRVQERNAFIRELGDKPTDAVVRALDARHIQPPPTVKAEGITTWRRYFRRYPGRVRVLISKARAES